jgi:2-oxoisovalerate dehydrogenase E1 component
VSRAYGYVAAIRDALGDRMEHDPRTIVMGIDVGVAGGPFTVTRGLLERFGPDRVLDTPIAETGFVGAAVGAAMGGLRPMVELMYFDFLGVCLEPLLNQAAKISYMSAGALHVPLVVRTQMGGGGHSAAQHSQNLEALVAHIPGLKVVAPATPSDAYGLLQSAFDDPGPVVYVEHRTLYRVREGERPAPDHRVPIGRARVVRQGTDLTVVSYSRALHTCLEAADRLAADGVAVEVIDLRTIAPLDMDTVGESVRATNRALVVHDAVRAFGAGAEVASRISDECFDWLDAPVGRVGAPTAPSPFAPVLEAAYLPSVDAIAGAARAVVGA